VTIIGLKNPDIGSVSVTESMNKEIERDKSTQLALSPFLLNMLRGKEKYSLTF
jgi:hypothetical protein